MITASIGSLEVSVIGLGCNNFGRALDQAQSTAVVRTALELGVTFFDTARNYGNGRSESFLGAALADHRDEVVIATKFGRVPRAPDSGGATRTDVRRSLDESLRQLGTDYIDLYQLHFPDPDTPIVETLGALGELVEEGKVRQIGCSNFDATLLANALAVSQAEGLPGFSSNQVHYSMIHREPEEDGLADLCLGEGVALLPYYPLASGLLTGKTRRGEEPQGRLGMDRYARFLTAENFDLVERVEGFARRCGVTPAQVALRWLLSRPAVPAVTPGATSPAQVVGNLAAVEWKPTVGDRAILDSLVNPDPATPDG